MAISSETAAAIWNCHREILTANKLLKDIAEERKERTIDRHAETLRDAFGRLRHFQLGIPSSASSHRLLDVHPDLAESVIRAHIANKEAELVKANEKARIELSTG